MGFSNGNCWRTLVDLLESLESKTSVFPSFTIDLCVFS